MSLSSIRPSSAGNGAQPEPDRAESFMVNLRQALEHISDEDWLKTHSPLESLAARVSPRAERANVIPSLGIKPLDERLIAIYKDWESRDKTPLQHALWHAARRVEKYKDANYPALLLLTYFHDPRPKQGALIKELALGKSTYYRQLDAAVQALERALISYVQPSLRLEQPVAKPLVGRDDVLKQCVTALRNGEVVSLIGASGLGKTALGAAIAKEWKTVFWHTFRLRHTDNAQQVLFALAFFLHQHGASDLWLHLNADAQHVGMGKAMGMIRAALHALRPAQLLFCFDEADLLLPRELDEDESHAETRAFLEDFVALGAPTLFMGQRPLIEATSGTIVSLNRLNEKDLQEWLARVDLQWAADAHENLLAQTRGNPLLIQLFISLQRAGRSNAALLSPIASVSLDGYLARLRRHLSPKELDALDALSVFDTPVPIHVWRSQRKALDNLITLNLVEMDRQERVNIPSNLREVIYNHLPADIRLGLHLSAAQIYEARGEFTNAARHYQLGDEPEMAIWVWHNHMDEELRQGQMQTALATFEPLRWRAMSDVRGRRALALMLARLYELNGKPAEGIASLDSVDWTRATASSSRAKELRARLMALRGDVEPALVQYRHSLDDLRQISIAREVKLRLGFAQHLLAYVQDTQSARAEALHAAIETERLLGEIEAQAGKLDAAQTHFEKALKLADSIDDAFVLAKLHENVGLLHTQRGDLARSMASFDEAERSYRAYGNQVCAIGITENNRAYAYMMSSQHDKAIPHLHRSLTFFESARMPHQEAICHANLAEAYLHTDALELAERHSLRGLRFEDVSIRPQCLYVLGHVKRKQFAFDEAERLCKDAIADAQQSQDVWALAPAYAALAETYRDWGRLDDAQTAFEQAIAQNVQLGQHGEAERLNILKAQS